MSHDAVYLLSYEVLPYAEPTPQQNDIKYLENKYGGFFKSIQYGCTIYWEKPKYLLPKEELEKLQADQILERQEGKFWEVIK